MPAELQPKILRVLQEGTFEPIGQNSSTQVDVRVISATNRDLKAAVGDSSFRKDLYYRIRVFDLRIPPLRERRGDMPLLVGQFLSEFTPPGERPPNLAPAAWAALEHYPFPGNVRELKHAIQHAIILARGSDIDLHHLPEDIRGEAESQSLTEVRPLEMALEQYEREYIGRTLKLSEGERKRAAEMLGISRKSLWKKMSKYGIR
jgi:transcriptional regulator with PAS, ATPase and Fis domain